MTALSQEAGGHRIQRVPPTERKGRVHTSTVTVAVLDGDSLVGTIALDQKDLKLEWYSGTGCGGQNRNKVMASCRLTHVPTGIVKTSQTRSRETSYAQALTALTQAVNEGLVKSKLNQFNQIRKNQVGSGERGDKIRTYRFQDDSVKDHRTNKSASVAKVMNGHFDLLWE